MADRERAPSRWARAEQQLEVVLRISRLVLETDLWGVAAGIARAAVELVDAQQGSVGLLDPESGDIYTAASLELPRVTETTRFATGEGVAGWVAATGRAVLIDDVRKDPRYLRLRYPSVRSFLSVPMLANGELLGVLSCGAWETHAFGELELKTLTAFGEHAAVTLRTAQEFQAQREQARQSREFQLDTVHELKAPLHAISGALDLLLRNDLGPLNETQRDFLVTGRQECTRLDTAIAGLLEMGVAQRRQRMATQMVGLLELVRGAIGRMRPAAETRQVELRIHLSDSLPELEIDPAAIQQVLTNLLSNAISVSPPHSAVVVSVQPQASDVRMCVDDSGPGVAEEHREHIFDRFYQAEPGGRTPGQVGIGLALCRDIVERHGGRIWAEDSENGGARLCFTLPLPAIVQA